MQLNKRDLNIYKNFLIQMKNGFNDLYLDEYAPVIQKFIEKYYVSDNEMLDDLDDFIQYALIMVIKLAKYPYIFYSKRGYLILSLKKIYQKMLRERKEEHLNTNPSYILDNDELFFKLLLQDIEKDLSKNRKVILDDYINDIKQTDTARRLGTSFQYVHGERNCIFEKLLKNEKFLNYYQIKEIPTSLVKIKK